MKAKLLSSFNLIVTIALIYWNYLSNTGIFDGKKMPELSEKYNSLFTPEGYAFSIWGIIFLSLVAFGAFAVYLAFAKPDKYSYVEKGLPFLLLANILNGTWVYLWFNENILGSVICMIFIFLSLLKVVLNLRMELDDVPCKVIAFVWWPIDLYFGWIIVAFVANVSVYLNTIGFSLGLQENYWVIIMVVVVTLINFLLIQKRNLREVALVTVWAFVAIAVRHWENQELIAYSALLGAAVLVITTQLHALRNKDTMPFVKKKWSEAI